MNAITWILFAMLPCIIHASRPPVMVSMQPRYARKVGFVNKDRRPVVLVSPTFRFRRSLDIAKRGIDADDLRFDPTVCDNNGDCFPVRGQISMEQVPMEIGLGLGNGKNNYLNAELKSVLLSGPQQKRLRKVRHNYDILRFGRSLDFQTPCEDCEVGNKNTYDYPEDLMYPHLSSIILESQDPDNIKSSDFKMKSHPSENSSSSPSIVKRDVHSFKQPTLANTRYTTTSSHNVNIAEEEAGIGDSFDEDSHGTF